MGAYLNGRSNTLVGAGERRSAKRHLVVHTSTIYWGDRRHVGLIRDVSRNGLFVYSDFAPAIGEELHIRLRRISCSGTVVRVESKPAGAAIGIAIRIAAYERIV